MLNHTLPTLSEEFWHELDVHLKTVDEDVWLSSRYAPSDVRNSLIALYVFRYELERISAVTRDPMAGQMRFAWWRTKLQEYASAEAIPSPAFGEKALAHLIGCLDLEKIQSLIDTYEAAYLGEMSWTNADWFHICFACELLGHEIHEALRPCVSEYAELKRGAPKSATNSQNLRLVPKLIRPVCAHIRLRRMYRSEQRDKNRFALQRRLCVLRGVLSGWV